MVVIRASRPHHLAITARDIDIPELALIHHGVLIRHVHQLYWKEGSPPSACKRRLGLLTAHGYLTATRLASLSGLGTGPLLLRAGKAAYPLLAKRLGLSLAEIRRAALAFPGYPAHHIAVVDAAITFRRAAATLGATFSWVGEHQLRQHPIHLTLPPHNARPGPSISLVPDGGFTLTSAAKRQSAYLECDLGTLSAARLSAKLTAYLVSQQTDPIPVLFIVPTTTRADQVIQLGTKAADALHADATRILVTTRDQLLASSVLTELIWYQLGTHQRVALLPPARASD